MPNPISIEEWQVLCERRLKKHLDYGSIVNVEWLRKQYQTLSAATSQTSGHLLLRILANLDNNILNSAENALLDLKNRVGFSERLEGLKKHTDDSQMWSKWNEIRSASLFARAGFHPTFSVESGPKLSKAADYYCDWYKNKIAIEVATISETKERQSAINIYRDKVDQATSKARKEGKYGVFGGVIPQPSRFKDIWTAVRTLMSIKKGSAQSSAADFKILHIISSQQFLSLNDFLPDSYSQESGLRYRCSGRIYNAFFGIDGQDLYQSHFIGHGSTYPLSVRKQKKPGRFVEKTSLAAAIFTLHDIGNDGNGCIGQSIHVIYTPVRGAGTPLPNVIINKLDKSFHFDQTLSIWGLNAGPHCCIRKSEQISN